MDTSFNIVGFIESNPVAKLSSTYNNKLLTKIKENFNETQQQLFVSSFYTYLNYHPTNDYVIDLDDVWKWLGFTQKAHTKTCLEKNFVVEKDYKILLSQLRERSKGGQNRQTIMLNVKTFKLLCIKAGTTKANEIHEYFVKLEEILHETIQEECVELKQQLENQVLISQNQQDILRENTILKHFPANTQCVYYGKIDNKSKNGEPLIKFGNSNFLSDRVKSHKKTYDNFYLINAFRVDNCQHIENAMKYHPILEKLRVSININNARFTELLTLNAMSYENLDDIIKDIIKKIEYSPENYVALLNENEKLKRTVHSLKSKLENIEKRNDIISEEEKQYEVVPELTTFKKVRRFDKAKDGKYHIEGAIYEKSFGTREEVWNGIAYNTSGELIKDDLMISTSVNGNGKIVSKAKSKMEKNYHKNRFEKAEDANN